MTTTVSGNDPKLQSFLTCRTSKSPSVQTTATNPHSLYSEPNNRSPQNHGGVVNIELRYMNDHNSISNLTIPSTNNHMTPQEVWYGEENNMQPRYLSSKWYTVFQNHQKSFILIILRAKRALTYKKSVTRKYFEKLAKPSKSAKCRLSIKARLARF